MLLVVVISGMIGIMAASRASADASPPLYPPGSDVLPAGETMVQMVSERVVVTIDPRESRSGTSVTDLSEAMFEAEFTMVNQGAATESMDVRFPLMDPLQIDPGWTRPIWAFAAALDGRSLQVHQSLEPFEEGYAATPWAIFPVTFEPGRQVVIGVKYRTGISGWNWFVDEADPDPLAGMNPDTANVSYTLMTGAAWYGPIESGVITLRLPYDTEPANVLGVSGGASLSPAVYEGNEVRWGFTDLEPSWMDDLRIEFLWPGEWNRILALRQEAEEKPNDPLAALRLAGAYLAAGGNVYAGDVSQEYCRLAQDTIDRALLS